MQRVSQRDREIGLNTQHLVGYRQGRAAARALDLAIAIPAFVIALPVLAVVALLSSLDSKGVTGVDRFLSAFNLNELPLLLDILKGDLSIVEPRPALASVAAQPMPQRRAALERLAGRDRRSDRARHAAYSRRQTQGVTIRKSPFATISRQELQESADIHN
jgi:lipopolysaccharide/colanic/teichoic acid biosynthesis glycosyltransferase